MTTQRKMNWEHGVVDLPSTSVPTKILTIYGGQSVTIKALATAGQYIYIGNDNRVSSATGYLMEAGEIISIRLPASFGVINYIEVWGVPSTAGDDVCYIKAIDLAPETEATT